MGPVRCEDWSMPLTTSTTGNDHCGREFGRLDNGNDQTPRKLSEWRKQLYSRMMRDEVPFAPSVQTLTCEVNVQQNITEIPRLTTDKEQFEHVNLPQTTSVSFGRWLAKGRLQVVSSGTADLRRHEATADSGHCRAWEKARRDRNASINTA